MALYTTAAAATTKLSTFAGLTVPSTTGSPSPMDNLIAEASALIEEYIRYAWAPAQPYTDLISLSRDGQGKLLHADRWLCPVSAVSAVAVPGTQTQYFGPAITLANTEWDSDGVISLAYPIVYQPQQWVNPVPFGALRSSLKLYPDELSVTYTSGPTAPVPAIFQAVCHNVMARILMQQDDPDGLMARHQAVRDLGVSTVYRDHPVQEALAPLNRYRLSASLAL